MDIFLWEWTLPPYHILSRGIYSLISRKKGQPEEGVTCNEWLKFGCSRYKKRGKTMNAICKTYLVDLGLLNHFFACEILLWQGYDERLARSQRPWKTQQKSSQIDHCGTNGLLRLENSRQLFMGTNSASFDRCFIPMALCTSGLDCHQYHAQLESWAFKILP